MNNKVDRWLLPDGIEELLPKQALRLEHLRRHLVDLFQRWGYDYVVPPMVEFTDSLFTGSGQDVELLTFKLTDQVSGKTMGIRADITPQAARMDAHSLQRGGVNRLCYAGHVLHTQAKAPLGSRAPVKAGVEMFGVASLDAEVEMVSLLLETLTVAKLEEQYVDLGHVAIFRTLTKLAALDAEQENTLFALLQSKAFPEIDRWLDDNVDNQQVREWLSALPKLSGGHKIIAKARDVFSGAPEEIAKALDDLQALSDIILARYPNVKFYFDLSELRGYHYHTGIVFAAFAPGVGNAIASGGRYDHVGEQFGRARSATGFDVDLTGICRLFDQNEEESVKAGIFVLSSETDALWQKTQELRHQGERVVMGVAGQEIPEEYQNCDRKLVVQDGVATVVSL